MIVKEFYFVMPMSDWQRKAYADCHASIPSVTIANNSSHLCLTDVIETSFCQGTKRSSWYCLCCCIRRHFINTSRETWHTVDYKWDAIIEIHMMDKCDFLKLITHSQIIKVSVLVSNIVHLFKTNDSVS